MPRQRQHRKPTGSQPAIPLGPMRTSMEEYLVWIETQNFSEDTVTTRRSCWQRSMPKTTKRRKQ